MYVNRNGLNRLIFGDLLNLFSHNVPFLYPLKTSEKQNFLKFLVGIEIEYWAKVG